MSGWAAFFTVLALIGFGTVVWAVCSLARAVFSSSPAQRRPVMRDWARP